MNKITFCPHLLFDPANTTPQQIEKEFITPLLLYFSEVEKYNAVSYFPAELIKEFSNHYPWTLASNPAWKKYILAWEPLIKSKLKKTILTSPTQKKIISHSPCCSNTSTNTSSIFMSFLESIATHSLVHKRNEEAVYAPGNQCNGYSDYIKITSKQDFKKAEFTWYDIYPNDLPCSGTEYFTPPDTWKTQPSPKLGPNKGYMDIEDREWVWDKFHKDHWDVQDRKQGRGKYIKVTPNGDII